MAQWLHMTRILQCLSHETVSSLYHPNTFPIEMRHYIAAWIENQRWEDFAMEKLEQESQAQALLDQTISMLQLVAEQNDNVVDKMKLIQISRNMAIFQQQPLQFAVMVRDILRKERALINASNSSPFPTGRDTNTQDVDHLVLKVLEVQKIRKEMHQLQEDLNWEKQNYESLQGSFQHNGLDAANTEIQRLQKRIQQLEFNVNTMSTQRFQLLKECVDCLDHCQTQLISRLKAWRLEQHKSAIGLPFDENLNPLQTWCEQLLGMNGNLRQELMLIGERILDLQERLEHLMQTLIESALIVDKQPPQVIKTQSKFSTTVRYLLGEKVAPGKPVVLKAQIVNELQARNLANVTGESVAELINNSAILEHNAASKSTCATFRNMSIKKIRRADRKGTESVTEEKFALLFSAEITITGCDTPYKIQMISQPLVVIVHGCQDNNALATIIWDSAFSEPDRVPFVVPERVPWRMMYNTLNCKFISEVQTQHNLDQFNQHFLAQKIFNKPDFADDFSNMMVSWSQFNKEVLPGRTFTFWQWFEGVMELTKKHLRTYWSEGLIFGFIGKQHLHLILKDRPNGTFMLRFSDSEIGGITIAYVSATENGGQKIQNIQPFTKRDLDIRSLGDRIRDINEITYLYPDLPKHDVFKKFYSEPPAPSGGGYIPVSLQTKVGMDAAPPALCLTPLAENSLGGFPMDASQNSNMTPLPGSPHSSFIVDSTHSPVAASTMTSLDSAHAGFPGSPFQQQFNTQHITEEILKNTSPTLDFNEDISAGEMEIVIGSILENLKP
ncbi:signal transducer and activator of transcription 6 isoform X2 [Salarias fasciatus]|uniref:signal transducer and activator of transcription 6 isoform X2 n=1 Tax=Salarias fasciatus TaxID=181472 RepID=UPI001176D3B0|nr:signal transducer and activator of transcription 6-like isoform X2 [Salarias fasciatus]